MIKPRSKKELFNDYGKYICASHLENLKNLGHDFIETEMEGAFFQDQKDAEYLDCVCAFGIFNLGRKHIKLIQRLKGYARDVDQGNFPMISKEKGDLARKLATFMPGDLEVSIFSVMRGEAFDAACKIARGYTEKPKIVSIEGSWSGQTGFALSLSTRDDKDLFSPLMPETEIIPFGDTEAAKSIIDDKTAAVMIEPIQAEAGCRMAGPVFLKAITGKCRETGALIIVDEPQTAFGRSGKPFAYEHLDIFPDAVIVGESLGGGVFPIAATVISKRMNSFLNNHPMIHLSTFGGSDLGCKVALKTLEIYENEVLWKNANTLGKKLKLALGDLSKTYSWAFHAVTGQGLLLAMELKNPVRAKTFTRKLAARGLFVKPGDIAKNTVLLRPPLNITESQADQIISAVGNVVKHDIKQKGAR